MSPKSIFVYYITLWVFCQWFLLKKGDFKITLFLYNIIQISPPEPSFMIFERVSCSFCLASSGILSSLVCNPSFTSSFSDLPKMLLCQILIGSSSNSLSRYFTKSSDCFSVPTTGLTSVSISARIRCIVRYKLRFLIISCFILCILAYF